jgi:hypothetical protein
MKRIVLISVGVLLGCRWATSAEGAEPGLVPAPGFEQAAPGAPPGNWRLPRPAYHISEDRPRSGSRCLEYRNGNGNGNVYQLASVPLSQERGRRYRFGVWVRTRDIAGDDTGATVCIEWNSADGMGSVRLIGAAGHTEAILGPLEPCMLRLGPRR